MKVGILTFHRATNYGAVLQTYALQKYLSKKGVAAEVIDYRAPFIEQHIKPIAFNKVFNMRWLFNVIFRGGYIIDNRKNFWDFVVNNIKISTEIYYTREQLEANNNSYDTYIVGSDQIWNYQCAGFDKVYFLDFVNEIDKKNAYAASFGVENIPDKYFKEYQELLMCMNSISVREETGKMIVRGLIGRNVQRVLDPTLLLCKKDWQELLVEIEEKDYILIYFIVWSEKLYKIALFWANMYNLKIKMINDKIKNIKNVENCKKKGPREWLTLLYNAKYILTNSFHGCAFSVNFNKVFYVDLLPAPAGVNSRLVDFLQRYKLMGRVVCDTQIEAENIDYRKINILLSEERKASGKFLDLIIEK